MSYLPINHFFSVSKTVEDMQRLGVLVDSISGALYSPADNALGTVANTLSPAIVYEIGQQFKENEELNKLDGGDRDEQGSTRHILAHALVGAVTVGLAGNDALTSALSAGGAEALAPKLASVLYGIDEKDVSKMTAEQKQTISAIISLAGTAVGAGSGSTTDMVASGEAGRVAVEENKTTIYIWQGVGNGESAFGHVSTGINGTSYSFGPNGMDVKPLDEVIDRQTEFRSGIAIDIPLNPKEEKQFEIFLKNYNGIYWIDFCPSPVNQGLHNLGFKFDSQIIPMSLYLELIRTGIGKNPTLIKEKQ